MAEANLGTATVRTRLDVQGLQSGLNTAGQQIGKFADDGSRRLEQLGARFTKLGGALTIGVTTPLVLLGRSFVNAASDAEETASKFETVFRSLGDGAERAADRFAESFGQSSTNARRLLGDTGDLLTGFGFTQAAALDLSVSVNELAVDLASFTNFSGGAEGASAALTKALLGETESLKSLGVAIRQTDVEAKVLELTQQGLTLESDRQAKAYATLALAQEQSVNAIGDYSRTTDSFANTQRRLSNALNELAVSFGTVLLPVATRAAEGLTGVVNALADLPGPAQTAIVVLAGIAAAGGPVILFTGQLLTAIPKITTALAGLRTASLGFLGPAGILALLGVGVAAFGKRLIDANPALEAQKDAVQALKDEYASYRGELVITSEAERAAAIDRLNTLRGEVQARLTLLAQLAAEEQQRAQSLIDSPLLQFLLPGFIDVRGGARQDTLAEIRALSETLAGLNLDQFVLQSGANTLVPPPGVTPPPVAPPPGGAGAGAGSAPPPVLPDPAAEARAWTERLLAEVEFGLRDAGDVFDVLSPRLLTLRTEAGEALSEFGINSTQFQDLLAKFEVVSAALRELGVEAREIALPEVTGSANRVFTPPGSTAMFPSDAEGALNPRFRAALLPNVLNREVAAIAEEIDLGPLGSAARREADTLALLIGQSEEALRDALNPTLARDLDFARRVTESGSAFQGESRDTARVDAAATALSRLNERTAIFTDTIQALVASGAPAEQVKTAFDSLLVVAGQLPPELVETYLALQGVLAVAAEGNGAIRRSGNRISGPLAPSPFRDGTPGAQPGEDEKGSTIGVVPITFDSRVVEEATNEGIRDGLAEIEESGAEFRDSVIQAGLQFATNLTSAIKSGSPSGIFGALTGGIGGIIGAVNPLAGAIFSTVGGIFAGLLPGTTARRQDAARASGANVRGAPAIELNFTFNQSLALASLTDPESRQALARQATDAFERIERIISTNLVPRLERLEASS